MDVDSDDSEEEVLSGNQSPEEDRRAEEEGNVEVNMPVDRSVLETNETSNDINGNHSLPLNDIPRLEKSNDCAFTPAVEFCFEDAIKETDCNNVSKVCKRKKFKKKTMWAGPVWLILVVKKA
ncbi:hypothetical protein Hanom_Chr08g00695941 [Helianthus anomalus]